MTVYNGNPAATHDPATGTAAPAAWGDLVNSNFVSVGEALITFDPAWTAETTNPVIGAGTKVGGYKQLNKLLFVRYSLKMGADTTYGSGGWFLALPNSLTVSTARTQAITAFIHDSGTRFYQCTAVIGEVSGVANRLIMIAEGGNQVLATSPMTWANGDRLVVEGWLEVV